MDNTIRTQVITDLMEYLMKTELFLCPESNIIQNHNMKIFDLLNQYLKDRNISETSEEIPWDESSVITDMYD